MVFVFYDLEITTPAKVTEHQCNFQVILITKRVAYVNPGKYFAWLPKKGITGKYGKNGKITLTPQYLLMSIEWF
jgi:hypothetical protein